LDDLGRLTLQYAAIINRVAGCLVMSLQDQISASIACIYDAALDRADWALALRQILDLLGGTAASLYFKNATGGRVIADDRNSEQASVTRNSPRQIAEFHQGGRAQGGLHYTKNLHQLDGRDRDQPALGLPDPLEDPTTDAQDPG
jgi:hypothetical protein